MVREPIKRIIRLLTTLQSGQAPSVDKLASLLGCSRRTLFRDLNTLQKVGVPIFFDKSRNGYLIKNNKHLFDTRKDTQNFTTSTLKDIKKGINKLLETASRDSNFKDKSIFSKKVFIVHGHNEGIRESVARFLEKVQLEPIILHEQPNKGRTIIEKFIDYSDVAFAVVLLTGDDEVRLRHNKKNKFKTRARQNVILELGFFLGRLGRERVCALYEEGVEIPSDYAGVVFVPIDNQGAWKLKLFLEMKAISLPVKPIG